MGKENSLNNSEMRILIIKSTNFINIRKLPSQQKYMSINLTSYKM